MTRLLDKDIRPHLLTLLRQDPSLDVLDEFGGGSPSICDVVAVGEYKGGEIEGFEIKSDGDSFARLYGRNGHQADSYGAIFDRLTLVTTVRHVPKALKRLPPWWGILVALSAGTDDVVFGLARPSEPNPEIKPVHVCWLLWADEVRKLARELGIRGVRNKPQAVEALVQRLTLDELRAEARYAIRHRPMTCRSRVLRVLGNSGA